MENMYEKAQTVLKKYGQEHLLTFYSKLDKENQEELLNQILQVNFEEMQKLYENINHEQKQDKRIEPIEFIEKSTMNLEDFERAEKIGEEELKKSKLAVLTMAGGQGTRLRT